jgi:tetratricopeptide (TPR) repeat protein
MYGQLEEGQREQANLGDSEPTSIDEWFALVAAKWIDRDYDGGVRLARRALELFPEHVDAYSWLGHCLIAMEEYTSGVQAIQNAQRVRERVEMKALLGFAYARTGQTGKAHEVLRELEETKRSRYVQPYFVARVDAALGEKDQALDYLEEAEHVWSEYLISPTFGGLRTDPVWDEYRRQDDPRYWAICEKVGLGKNQWPRDFDLPK